MSVVRAQADALPMLDVEMWVNRQSVAKVVGVRGGTIESIKSATRCQIIVVRLPAIARCYLCIEGGRRRRRLRGSVRMCSRTGGVAQSPVDKVDASIPMQAIAVRGTWEPCQLAQHRIRDIIFNALRR